METLTEVDPEAVPLLRIDPIIEELLDRILAEQQRQERSAPIYVCVGGGRYPCGKIYHGQKPTVCDRCGTDHRM